MLRINQIDIMSDISAELIFNYITAEYN